MAARHKYPTRRQLEKGVTVKAEGDPALDSTRITELHLLLGEGMGEDEELEKDFKHEDLTVGMVVHARVPDRKRLVFCGILPFGVYTSWDKKDARALLDYITRLVEKRHLDIEMEVFDIEIDEDEEDEDELDESAIVHVNDSAEFEKIVLKSKLPVLVDFTGEWCGPCMALAPHLAELAIEKEGELVVVKIDIDNNEDLANQYNIEAVPTLLLFNAGKLVKKMEGFEGKAKLKKWLE